MGYSGLDNWVDSDNAADLVSEVWADIAKRLKKHLKKKGNCFNTSGCVDVALFFRSFILPIDDNCFICDELFDVAQDTIEKLEKEDIKEAKNKDLWDGDEGNRLWHLESYRSLKKDLEKFIKNATKYTDREYDVCNFI